MAKIVPGILTLDEQDYQNRLKIAEHVTDLIQIDLVDGIFSKNKTVGVEVIKKFSTSASLEVQLMVDKPSGFIKDMENIDYVSRIIFPYESSEDVNSNIYAVKKSRKQIGVSLNPGTDIGKVLKFADDIDLLLLMTGKPGYSGQKLGGDTYTRIAEAKNLMPSLALEIDIGVNFENAKRLAGADADFLVASSALYGADDFRTAFEKLSKLASNT